MGEMAVYYEIEGPQCLFIVSDKPFFEWVYLQKAAKDAGLEKVITDKYDTFFGVAVYNEMPALSTTFEAGGRFPPNVIRAGTKLFINPLLKNKLPTKVLINILGAGSEFFMDSAVNEKFDLHFISRHPNDHSMRGIYRRKGWSVDDPLLYCIGNNPDKPSTWKHIYYKGNRDVWNPPSMTIDEHTRLFLKK